MWDFPSHFVFLGTHVAVCFCGDASSTVSQVCAHMDVDAFA